MIMINVYICRLGAKKKVRSAIRADKMDEQI